MRNFVVSYIYSVMRVAIQIIISILLCSLVVSCDWAKQNLTNQTSDKSDKIYLSDLEYVSNNGIQLIYKDNALFTGEAWSSDGQAFCIICQNGRLVELQGKNQNQSNALVINLRPGKEFGRLYETFNEVYYLNDGRGNLIMRLGKVNEGWRHECLDGTMETITNKNFIQDAFPGHAELLRSYEAILDIELKKRN